MFGPSSQEVHFGFFICVQIEDCGIQSYSEQNAPLSLRAGSVGSTGNGLAVVTVVTVATVVTNGRNGLATLWQ